MKTVTLICTALALTSVSGCFFSGTKVSPTGGIVSQDEGFSISVPTTLTLQQGAEASVLVTLNRGAYFKQDVRLAINADGISVFPTYLLVKASDKPDVKVQITVPKEAALGEYRVSVKGTPKTGNPASTEFIVKVVSQ